MVSNPKMKYQVFLCIFQKKLAMATLGLKEMGKFLWEGREIINKNCHKKHFFGHHDAFKIYGAPNLCIVM
jgi:hypothetical protein